MGRQSVPADDPKKPSPETEPKITEPDNGEGLAEVFREIESDDPPETKVEEPPT